MPRKKKRQTIGKKANRRSVWSINPETRIKESKKRYNRKDKHKEDYRNE